MSNGDIKMSWIKSQNKAHLSVLADVVNPDVLGSRVPRLAAVQEARQERQNILKTMRELGKFKDNNLRFVAEIDVSVWQAILDIFARTDPDTGELIDDGLLYKFDPDKGCIVMNKDFFFTLINFLEESGYSCDMRGTSKITI